MRTLANILVFFICFFLCLFIDARIGLHVFTLGFLLSSLFFMTTTQMFFILFFMAFFHDVRFQFPMGVTFLIVFPFMLLYPFMLRVLRSRMVVLYSYLTFASVVSTVFQNKNLVTPEQVLWSMVLSGLWVGVVYAYSLSKFKNYSFRFNHKLRF